ncbi:hypothetical protein APASM_3844 [Actinosynnema pretiosum subsp. pretiosum]|nr:hypothetical protein APASM_3844 [Actinosynnema pretiosum subsp. pretiosum]
MGPDPHATVVEQWHAVQNCVAGLYNDLADSIWDQLECHQALSWIMWNREGSMWATGDTYELESWRPKLIRDFPRLPQYLVTECGNNLGLKPAGPFRSPIRPDLGVVDLQGAADAIA